MKNIFARISGVVTALALTVMASAVTYASELSTSTAISAVNALKTDVGLTMGEVITGILGLLAALIGLGWGVRKFMRWVSGRKF